MINPAYKKYEVQKTSPLQNISLYLRRGYENKFRKVSAWLCLISLNVKIVGYERRKVPVASSFCYSFLSVGVR